MNFLVLRYVGQHSSPTKQGKLEEQSSLHISRVHEIFLKISHASGVNCNHRFSRALNACHKFVIYIPAIRVRW